MHYDGTIYYAFYLNAKLTTVSFDFWVSTHYNCPSFIIKVHRELTQCIQSKHKRPSGVTKLKLHTVEALLKNILEKH